MFGSFTNVKDEFLNKYFTDWVNEWSGGALVTAPKPLNISLYLFYVIKELCAAMGYEARGDLFLDKELEKLIVFNNWIFEWDNGFEVDEYRLVPDISVSQFFEKLASLGIAIDIDSRRNMITFDLVKNIPDRIDIVDWTELFEFDYQIDFQEKLDIQLNQSNSDGYAGQVTKELEGKEGANTVAYPSDVASPPVGLEEYAYVQVEESHYKVTQVSPLEMERFHQNPDYQFGDGERFINIPETLLVAVHQGYANALMPKCDFEWSDKDQVSDFPLQLVFYRGMQVSRSSLTYPALTGSNLVTNSLGIDYFEESGSLKLSPAGENGWAVNMYTDWAQRLSQTKVVKRKFQLPITDLVALNMNQPVRIYSSHFIIKQMSSTMLQSGQLRVELDLLRL